MTLVLLLALTVPGTGVAVTQSKAALGLQKSGEGRFTWFGLPIYSAELWAGEEASPERLFVSPLLLTLEYDRRISKERIVDATVNEWQRLGGAQSERQRQWAAALLEILPDVRAGDQLSSLFVPGQGTLFYLGSEEIGRIEDPEFGPAFLSIWLDRDTRAERLRRKLLARMGKPS